MTNNRRDRTRIASSEETAEQLRVIGVHGAVEQHAGATRALSEVLTGAENAGAAIDLFDLAELTLPLYNSDQPEPQEGVAVVRRIARADAVILATSVRHDSYSAQLKTALEYCGPEEFDSKPVGLLGVTEGSEPALALEHLRTVCTTLNAWVLPMQVSITAAGEHDELAVDSVNALRTLGQQIVDRVFHEAEGSGEDI
ncbi:NADPH-dependent FMN reductase [Halococcus salsus]|uniref:NADPH-dependent FMN reductase n=1 Tax=Halococcus salsus TaxID=2162894 RepID=UPI001359843B|nr:NAD(P)H-dependent oxidoreductase [Halococcus salsus]